MTTLAEEFFNNPNIQKAEESLINTLAEYQSRIDGIRSPKSDRVKTYEETLEDFSGIRGGKLFYPYLSSGIGSGPFVELEDGSIKYDFISGIGVHHLGHSHPEIIKACIRAALKDTVMQGNLQQDRSAYDFSKKLLNIANSKGNGQFDHCFLSTTGVMAGENSLKIAFQKKYPADRVLAFKHCFAGRTLAFSSITDKAIYRMGLPQTLKVDYVPFYDHRMPDQSLQCALSVLDTHLKRYPNQYAAMIFELIQGEGGYYTAPSEFHTEIMKRCREYGIAILVDEVQTFGRTEELFAFQSLGLGEYIDVLWIGKASQVCATLFRSDMAPKPGLLSQTFTSSTTAIAAGEVIVDTLLNGGYLGSEGKINMIHKEFLKHFESMASKHKSLFSGPYGVGGMVAFTAFGGDNDLSLKFIKQLFHNGVLSFIAGANPTRVRFLPPVGVVESKHIAEVCEIIEKTLLEVQQ